MRFSELYIPTLRDKQSDAELDSHQFLLRGGYIRKLAPGHFHSLPLMQRVVARFSKIIREEFDAIGGQEVGMPLLSPAELWRQSGRAELLGADQMHLRDRRGHDFVLCGSHEEVVSSLVAGEVRSYRQLPLRLYQIGTNFRDEPRTRFGLMRMREFLMAALYAFDADTETGRASAHLLSETCQRVFERIGLEVMTVPAATGPLGQAEGFDIFAILDSAPSEATVVACESCDYKANAEIAAFRDPMDQEEKGDLSPLEAVDTPGATTIDDITTFLKVKPTQVVKTLLYMADGAPVAALIRGDRDLSPAKMAAAVGTTELELADAEQVVAVSGAPVGFAGPVGLAAPLYVDPLVAAMKNFVVGANKADRHLINVNLDRDFEATAVADLTLAADGDPCPDCGGRLRAQPGLLVGNVAMLGDSITSPLGALVSDADGVERPMMLSCAGIGLSRTVQTVLESHRGAEHMIWPPALAPFDIEILPLNCDKAAHTDLAADLCRRLEAEGLSVLVDDRPLRPGVKFHDADLLGIPVRLVIGDKSLAEGQVEFQVGMAGAPVRVEIDRAVEEVKRGLEELK